MTDKKLQEITPAEIHELTLETYTNFKKEFIEKNKDKLLYSDKEFTVSDYINRLEYELKVIKQMWFNTYFLIVADYVNWSKKNEIMVWPWRWSWAWSILAWLVWITDIDPLPFGLLFERFLNPARVSMPDFDIDFEDIQRDRVIGHVREKYWEENVCSIWTFMKMASKAAFKDAARAVWIDFERSNKVSSLMPEKTPITVAIEMEGNEELKSIYDNDENIQKAVKFGEELEWNIRQLWVHACGIIIAPKPVYTFSPMQYLKEDDHSIVSQYDWPTMEKIWLLKMDFLWLRNLSIIKNCIKILKKRYEKEWKALPKMFEKFFVDMSFQPDMTDKYTYDKVFKEWDTSWIFQFESNWMRKYLIQLSPDKIDNLVAMNALYRPWPMEFIPSYIARKTWAEPVKYMQDELRATLTKLYWEATANEEEKKLIEDLSPIMWDTYWIAIYQEQLMFLVQNMAWFSLWEADLLRRWIWKKKKEIIEKLKIEFTERWQEFRWYKPETTRFIYEKMIEPAASYSFNKSHAVCYAWVAYQTAYLKAHFPVEFYAALIRSVEEDIDEQSKYIYETQNHWIHVQQPDINESYNHVAAIDWKIRLWFLWIKGIWFEIWEFIQQERQKSWEYKSLEDFLKRCDKVVNKKSLEWLIKSWALDKFQNRNTLLNNIDMLLWRSKSSQNMSMWLFWADESATKIVFNKQYETTFEENLMYEQEVFKCFVSGHLLDWLYKYLKKNTFLSRLNVEKNVWPFEITWYISNIQRAKKKWFFIEVEDISWKREFFLKDVLNLKKFDIIKLSWYKNEWRYPKISKMIKTNRDLLIKNAWWSYDPEMTVTKAKWLRLGEIKTELLEIEDNNTAPKQQDNTTIWTTNEENFDDGNIVEENTTQDVWYEENNNIDMETEDIGEFSDQTEVEDTIDEEIENEESIDEEYTQEDSIQAEETEEKSNEEVEEVEKKSEPENLEFDIPNNITDIQKLKTILTQDVWNIKIRIWWIEKSISEEWLEKIKNLLKK